MQEIDQNKNSDLIEVISVFHKTIKKHGIKRVIQSLVKIQHTTELHLEDTEQQVLDFICFKVFSAYQTSLQEMRETTKRGRFTNAKKMAFVLFNQHLKITQREIATFWRINSSKVNIAIKEFHKLNSNIRSDKDFKESFDIINIEVNKYKEALIIKYSNNNN